MRKLHNDGKVIDIDSRLPALLRLVREEAGVLAAFLFGSYGTADQTPLSDVDLAFVFRPGAVVGFAAELEFRGRVLESLRQDDVSILILNRASPILQFRVLATGRLLYCSDPGALADFTAEVLIRHADFAPDYRRFLREYDAALVAEYGHAESRA